VLAAVILFGLYIKTSYVPEGNTPEVSTSTPVLPAVSDAKNTSYTIDGEAITLTNGKFTRPAAPGSASLETFMLFGEPVMADLDGDGDLDAVSYLTRDGGGSGTFFYVVVALNNNSTFTGTNALFLGDRIAPQNISIDKGNAVANFAERRAGEAFTVQPSVGKSVWVHLNPATKEIGELVQHFEGEANPNVMSLSMKTWNWIQTDNADGSKVTPKKAGVFTLTFSDPSRFSAKTDCNGVGGEYVAKASSLTFEKMMSTMMYCEGSQEQVFSSMLSSVTAYHFTTKGELVLELKDKSTAMLR
jgi:heat shock protein HslJ